MSDLNFLETDSESIYRDTITQLEKHVSEPLYPGDERRIFGDALSAVIVALFNKVNDVAKKKMLQYASGTVLDALGARYGCNRISPTPATVTLRFSMEATVSSNVLIPEGTRATPDNEVYFKTIEAAVIQAGNLYVDVEAECCTTGASYNDYLVDSIKQMVDIVPYVDNVTNITTTYGGGDGEPYPEEDGGTGDDHYRERIKLAPTSLSVAGPEGAYKYHAASADASISDVAVLSDVQTRTFTLPVYADHAFLGGAGLKPGTVIVEGASTSDYTVNYADSLLEIVLSGDMAGQTSINISVQEDMAGKVLIVPILEGGEIPDQTILDKVYTACNASDVRPMTDQVVVQSPEQVEYTIEITYYTTLQDESDCITAIEGAGGALELYKEWQDTVMGRAINPDKLRSLCLAPEEGKGCTRITVTSPAYTELTNTQVAKCKGMTVNHVLEV